MKAVVVGCSAPIQSLRPGYFGSGILVSSGADHVLLDCGPGIAKGLADVGVRLSEIGHLLLTHHHWDHISDLPTLVMGRWQQQLYEAAIGGNQNGQEPLEILGPRNTERICNLLFGGDGVFAEDIATRLAEDIGGKLYPAHGAVRPAGSPAPVSRDLEDDVRFEVGDMSVEVRRVLHCQPHMESVAFRLEVSGHSIVYTGDTQPDDGIVSLANQADILFHEAHLGEEIRKKLGLRRFHSTVSEVAEIAERAGVGSLVIVHHNLDKEDVTERLEHLRRIAHAFTGRVHIARAGDTFSFG